MSYTSTTHQADTMAVAQVAEYLYLHLLTARNLNRESELPASVLNGWHAPRAGHAVKNKLIT